MAILSTVSNYPQFFLSLSLGSQVFSHSCTHTHTLQMSLSFNDLSLGNFLSSFLFPFWLQTSISVLKSFLYIFFLLGATRKKKIGEVLHATMMSMWSGLFWRLPGWKWKSFSPAGEMSLMKASNPRGDASPRQSKIGFHFFLFHQQIL